MRPKAKLSDNYGITNDPMHKRRQWPLDGSNTPDNVASSSQTDLNKTSETQNETSGSSDEPDSPTGYKPSVPVSRGGREPGEAGGIGKKIQHGLQKSTSAAPSLSMATKHDPEDYYHAKKKLKKAVLECYR